MKLAFYIVGACPGAGRTMFAKFLLHRLRSLRMKATGQAPKIAAFDGCKHSPYFARTEGLKSHGAYDSLLNIESPFEGVQIFDALDREKVSPALDALDLKADILLFDMPAGPLAAPRALFGNMDDFVAEHARSGYRLHVVNVVNQKKAAAQGVAEAIRAWGPNVRHAVVKAGPVGEREEPPFLFFDGEKAGQAGDPLQALRAVGGKVCWMPFMPGNQFFEMESYDASCAEILADASVDYHVQNELHKWLEKMNGEFARLRI